MSGNSNIYKQESVWGQTVINHVPTKFSTMHHWADVLTDHRKSSAKEKMSAMQSMMHNHDADTRDHFRAALTEVLRSEKIPHIRHEAIKLLGIYFTWGEIEWTWWLHEKRQPRDIEQLAIYEWYAKNKTINRLDANLMLRAVKMAA